MDAAYELSQLDEVLELYGEDVMLRRPVGNNVSWNSVQCRAFVRLIGVSDDIIGTIAQQAYTVVMSPTQINNANWPGGAPSGAEFPTDFRIPRKGDRIIRMSSGRIMNVETAAGIYLDDLLIRIDARTMGQA